VNKDDHKLRPVIDAGGFNACVVITLGRRRLLSKFYGIFYFCLIQFFSSVSQSRRSHPLVLEWKAGIRLVDCDD